MEEDARRGFVEDAELLAEAVVDTIHEGLLILDASLRVRVANNGFYRTFGVAPEATINKLVYEVGDGQWNIPDLRRLLENVLPSNSHFENFQVSQGFPHTGHRVLSLNARKLHRRRNQEPLILLAIEDISVRKLVDDAVKRSNNELADFARVISHDLQEPVRTIKLFAQALARHSRARWDAKAGELLQQIEDATQNMEDLIASTLSYAIATAPEPDGKELLSLDGVLHRALANLREHIEREAAEIHSDPLPTVHAYPMQILQMFQNLLSNAIKYHRAGIPPYVKLSAAEQPEHWIVSVQDNGIGIARQHYDRIFEPLKRLHGREIPGTGIGLATCRKIAAHHGGEIWVDSELGVGSVFYFSLKK